MSKYENLKKILLAEDDDADAELTIDALKQNNLKNDIVRVANGEEVLDYLFKRGQFKDNKDNIPTVVLLDLKMPKINGIEVLRQIRENPKLKYTPVVVLTSSHEDRDLKSCHELGVNAYIVKPVDFHEFVNAVKTTGNFWGLLNNPLA